MSAETVKIGPFSFNHFSLPYFSDLLKDAAFGTSLSAGKSYDEKWPRSDEDLTHLTTFAKLLENVEAKTGAKFDRNIMVTSGNAGIVMVNGMHMITIDDGIVSGQSPISKNELEDALTHEASHVRHKDAQAVSTLLTSANPLLTAHMLSNFYHEEPDKFAHLVQKDFGGVEQFRTAIGFFMQSSADTVSVIEKLPGYETTNDLRMLEQLYDKDSAVSKTMASLPRPDMDKINYQDMLKLGKMYMQSEKLQELAKASLSAQGIPLDSPQMQEFFSSGPYAKIDEPTKAALDRVDKKLLAPAAAKFGRFLNFADSYGHAAEYRADDTAIIHSSNPENYPNALGKLVRYMDRGTEDTQRKMQELPPPKLPLAYARGIRRAQAALARSLPVPDAQYTSV